jgi:hypothetical protein
MCCVVDSCCSDDDFEGVTLTSLCEDHTTSTESHINLDNLDKQATKDSTPTDNNDDQSKDGLNTLTSIIGS